MSLKTTDLSDAHSPQVRIAEPIGFKDYGGIREFHGQIHTIKCHEDNSYVRKALETDGTGKVLIVDGGGSIRCALLGDMLGELAVKNKWNGIVIYGCIRDSVAMASLALGVKALNTHPLKSNKQNIGQENIAVHFAGIDFIPDQWIYCDEDGILIIDQTTLRVPNRLYNRMR